MTLWTGPEYKCRVGEFVNLPVTRLTARLRRDLVKTSESWSLYPERDSKQPKTNKKRRLRPNSYTPKVLDFPCPKWTIFCEDLHQSLHKCSFPLKSQVLSSLGRHFKKVDFQVRPFLDSVWWFPVMTFERSQLKLTCSSCFYIFCSLSGFFLLFVVLLFLNWHFFCRNFPRWQLTQISSASWLAGGEPPPLLIISLPLHWVFAGLDILDFTSPK